MAVLATAAPVKASHVSLEVIRPAGRSPEVGADRAVVVKQGSTLEAVIRVGEVPYAEAHRIGEVYPQQLRWLVPVRLGTRAGPFGPRFPVLPRTVGGEPQPITQRVNVPIDLSCGMQELTACAIYLAPTNGSVSGPRTGEGTCGSWSPLLPVYVDCSAPGIDVHAPSPGACIRPGESVAIRMTATDDIGVKRVFADLGPLGSRHRDLTMLERSVTFSSTIGMPLPHPNGVINARFEAEDWAATKIGRGFRVTLDGSVPPTIGMDRPTDAQLVTTTEALAISGPAADPGCGLDRIEIGVRQRGGSGPFRVVKTIREFPSARSGLPTPSFTYRAELPAGTLAPGLWDLQAEAISQTGRRAGYTRHIRITAGPGLAPAPAPGRQPLPGIPSRPPITIPR